MALLALVLLVFFAVQISMLFQIHSTNDYLRDILRQMRRRDAGLFDTDTETEQDY